MQAMIVPSRALSRLSVNPTISLRRMATIRSSLPHVERTAAEPRENSIEPVLLSHIHEVNSTIRLLRLTSPDPTRTINFLPGQWLDTFIPGLRSAGGFTITSTPHQARPSRSTSSPAFLELAVQKSTNPPAQWLWKPTDQILGAQLAVRVGGSFTWPPPNLDASRISRLVLIAGGVGINPLISIFSHLIRSSTETGAGRPKEVHFVYTTKATASLDPQEILFVTRLLDLVAAADDQGNVTLSLFLTNVGDEGKIEHGSFPNRTFGRRVQEGDLVGALDGYAKGADRSGTVAYVCGPPRMTDEFVEVLRRQDGMSEERVLCEKWW